MKKIVLCILTLLIPIFVMAQGEKRAKEIRWLNTVDSHISNLKTNSKDNFLKTYVESASNFYKIRNYMQASDNYTLAILFSEKKLKENIDGAITDFLTHYTDLLLLKYNRIWCNVNNAATITLTREQRESVKRMVLSDCNYLLKYFLDSKKIDVLWGAFNKEDVYFGSGLNG